VKLKKNKRSVKNKFLPFQKRALLKRLILYYKVHLETNNLLLPSQLLVDQTAMLDKQMSVSNQGSRKKKKSYFCSCDTFV
jgi:hypothetical protein